MLFKMLLVVDTSWVEFYSNPLSFEPKNLIIDQCIGWGTQPTHVTQLGPWSVWGATAWCMCTSKSEQFCFFLFRKPRTGQRNSAIFPQYKLCDSIPNSFCSKTGGDAVASNLLQLLYPAWQSYGIELAGGGVVTTQPTWNSAQQKAWPQRQHNKPNLHQTKMTCLFFKNNGKS